MFKYSKSKHLNFLHLYEKAHNLFDEIPAVKRKKRLKKIKNFFWGLGIILLVFVISFIFFFGKEIVLAEKIVSDTLKGKNNIEQAIDFVRGNDFEKAIIFSDKASIDFSRSIESAQKIKNGFFVGKFPFLYNQAEDLENLIITADTLSRSLKQGAGFAQNLEDLLEGDKKLSFSKFTQEEKRKILERIYSSSPELAGMKANLDLAILSLEKVRFSGFLWFIKSKIIDLQVKIIEADQILGKAISMSQILPALAGYPEKANFLVLLQNNDELRPTGGFLGTYGILEIEYGEIVNFETHDIYHMDMPIKNKLKIDPPVPLKKYLGVDNWYMRDANWSPDWPESSQKIEWFYKQEDALFGKNERPNSFNGEFDGVIGITPNFIIDLLSIVGPIKIEGIEYDKDNFTNLLEYRVEKGYVQLGVSSWQRKEVIGVIAKELKNRLFDLPSSRWSEIINVIDSNIAQKNIIVFVKDQGVEFLLKERGWGGEIKETAGDYLMVVDANMAALKTDAVVNRNIEYSVEQGNNGLFAKVTINYSNNGQFDWRTTRYRTYTRIFVPVGSQLIKSSGATEGVVEVKNEINGKTSFGVFKSIEPGKIGSLYFEYKLPDNLNILAQNGEYELYIQKQPGSDVDSLTVDLKLINSIKSYNPASFYAERISDNKIRWEGDFKTDKIFEVK